MRAFRAAMVLILCSALPGGGLSEADVEAWVADLGGSVTRDTAGKIKAINLRGAWVTDVDLENLSGLDSLEKLDLSQTHITDIALDSVAQLPNLRELDLRFCEHITEAGAARLREATRLERLNLRGARVSDSGVEFLSSLPNLKSLDIAITQITDPSLEHLEKLENLEELAIGGNRIGEVGLNYLRALPNLRKLDLSGSQITDSGVWGVTVTDVNVEIIASLTTLEELNLAAADQEYVANIGDGVPRLRNRIQLTDLGLAKLAPLKKLRILNLTRSEVTGKGLLSIAALPQLERLTLAHTTKVDDSAAAALLKMDSLKVLDLTATGFGDDGLRLLAGHPSLERVLLTGAAASEAAIEEFQQKKPKCEVLW